MVKDMVRIQMDIQGKGSQDEVWKGLKPRNLLLKELGHTTLRHKDVFAEGFKKENRFHHTGVVSSELNLYPSHHHVG